MRGLITWFIKNPVASNLLMIIILVGGLVSTANIDNEFFPDIQPNIVQVIVPYPGAGPLEVEEQICMKIEEAISDVEGIDEVRSSAAQGVGIVTIETVEEDAVAGIDINPTIIVLVVLGEVEGIDSEANRPIKILKR